MFILNWNSDCEFMDILINSFENNRCNKYFMIVEKYKLLKFYY